MRKFLHKLFRCPGLAVPKRAFDRAVIIKCPKCGQRWRVKINIFSATGCGFEMDYEWEKRHDWHEHDFDEPMVPAVPSPVLRWHDYKFHYTVTAAPEREQYWRYFDRTGWVQIHFPSWEKYL